MTRHDDLRLMAKVADMYYQRRLKQSDICRQLGIHQSTISRLLKRAEIEGIVQFRLHYPVGFYPELERALEVRFGLAQAIVVDTAESEAQLLPRLGSAAGLHLASTIKRDDVIGVSSWSSSLLAMVDSMHPIRIHGATVVQILGGVGNPAAEVHATRLTHKTAQVIGGRPVFLPAPGVAASIDARDALLADHYVEEAVQLFGKLTMALVGIGAVEPSPLLIDSGNAFSSLARDELQKQGAVGDVCLRFFDAEGLPVVTTLNDRVIGITLEQLQKVPKVIAVAGGSRKLKAIHAVLKSGLVDVLVTDSQVAASIVEEQV